MVSRPYKCPLCHSVFRNESGMKWHIAHRHDIPTAFDALGKDQAAKTLSLQSENQALRNNVEVLTRELERTRTDLETERARHLKWMDEVIGLRQDLEKALGAIVIRDLIIKNRLGIEMPNPFEKKG